ncbi:hypothetical protein [Rodentibacter pneumotropicus]|uniref:hypothetical protein n=1 Tax=Rodentibacter pneumotropicus TaxID=758 RepID=UPI0009863B9C|nr:hypothetical protein [Rodentibacter pneumotropicus]OOF62070.1 hypothetical protein BKL50_06745 [Rodentibacter pneumotropicus]THA18309.1 hypothetical protein D3M83_06180 [Rodentibacter pneumotropicus]
MNKKILTKLRGKSFNLLRAKVRRQCAKTRQISQPSQVSKVQSAINLAVREKKPVDIANYNCVKGKATTNTVRAKQKRQMGCRELVRV